MLILAFTTSTDKSSVALSDGRKILASSKWSRNAKTGKQSDALILKINSLLKKAKCTTSELTLVAVDRGPGSFTGSRIAVNVAKTLSYTLGVPLFSPTSLDIMAYATGSQHHGRFVCVLDAHKALVYCQWYSSNKNVAQPKSSLAALSLGDLLPLVQAGDWVVGLCPQHFAEAFKSRGAMIKKMMPDAQALAFMAGEKSILTQTWKDVEPSYIRSPEAVEKLQQK